jgi:hypothetical protein
MRMKKFVSFLMCSVFLIAAVSCHKDDPYKLYDVKVQLVYSDADPVAGVTVNAVNTNTGMIYVGTTDAQGNAVVPAVAGLYEFSATETRAESGTAYSFNGFKQQVAITHDYEKTPFVVTIDMVGSEAKQIIVKELYTGGCQKDDGSGYFQNDKYVILYNNSTVDADLKNLCFAMTIQYNSHTTNVDVVDGKLTYEAENRVPAGHGFWTFAEGNAPVLKPGEEVVVAINGAINHTLTYSNSVNLSNSNYYAMYDPESGYSLASYYPTPSEAIPTSHYLKAYKYGTGTGWPISVTGPAFFIFITPDGVTPQSFFEDTSNENLYDNKASGKRKWVSAEWVVDACEVFSAGYVGKNNKRLITSVDGGSVVLTNRQGYSIYRNVNKEATEAIAENKGKLVYSYNMGTNDLEEGSTDPSGIDAEASIKAGARIIYMDTNNSGNDFHQRKEASLRSK